MNMTVLPEQFNELLVQFCRSNSPTKVCSTLAAAAKQASKDMALMPGRICASFSMRMEAIASDENDIELGEFLRGSLPPDEMPRVRERSGLIPVHDLTKTVNLGSTIKEPPPMSVDEEELLTDPFILVPYVEADPFGDAPTLQRGRLAR